jgi:predicted nucleic-acid-binding protein
VIAVDTNVLLRLIVQDDPEQALIAKRLLQDSFARSEPCFIADVVLCEVEWVLTSRFRAQRSEILAIFQDLLTESLFDFEDRHVIRDALDAYQQGGADFSDYLIGGKGVAHGARITYTFDRSLRGRDSFSFLEVKSHS